MLIRHLVLFPDIGIHPNRKSRKFGESVAAKLELFLGVLRFRRRFQKKKVGRCFLRGPKLAGPTPFRCGNSM